MLSLIILLVTIYLSWAWLNRRRSNEPPAYPGAWPIIGHGHLFLGDDLHIWRLAKTVTSKCMEMGHTCFLRIGHIKIYILTDPDDISKVANTCYEKDSFSQSITEELLARGLLFSPVSIWKRHRKLITPTLNQEIIDGFLPVFNSQARKLVKVLAMKADGEPFDQTNCIRQHFMKTICLTALDDAISEEDTKNYIKSFDTFLNCYISRFQRFWLHYDFLYQFTDLKKKQDECIKTLRDVCDSVLQRKRAQRNHKIDKENSGRKIKTFIDLIMDLPDGELTDKEIRDETTTMIIGGLDTCSSVTIFGLLLIGSHPDVQEKLYKELEDVFGNTDSDVKKQDLSRLVYLEAVLKETMRYYETGPLIARYIDQEVKLILLNRQMFKEATTDSEVCSYREEAARNSADNLFLKNLLHFDGYKIVAAGCVADCKNCTLQPGHNCFLMLHGVHRSPIWGRDVDKFNPERWLHPDTLPKNPNAFVSFSLGRRDCIGKRYAMMSLKTTFSHILRRYKIRSDHTKLVLKYDILLKTVTGHEISIEDRLK